jgi:hypothetical protein
MKLPRMLLTLPLAMLVLSISSCSKKDGPGNLYAEPPLHPLVGGPYLVQMVDGPDKWRLISTSRIGTRYSGVRRLFTADAAQVALYLKDDDDNELKWYVHRQLANLPPSDPRAGNLVSIHVAVQRRFYWAIEEGGSVSGRREYRLFLQQYDGQFANIEAAGDIPDVRDDSKFVAIKVVQGGKTYYQFESYMHPGFFLTNKGHTNAGNGILIESSTIQTPALFEMKKLQ